MIGVGLYAKIITVYKVMLSSYRGIQVKSFSNQLQPWPFMIYRAPLPFQVPTHTLTFP